MAEATQDAAKPARKKNAHYDVFVQVRWAADGMGEVDGWISLKEDIAASSRREAIVKATVGSAREDAQYGTFMVIRHGEAQVLTRAKKTIVADDWGT